MIEPSVVASTITAVVSQNIEISTTTHVMNAMDIFQQVCSFYDTAWNNLIIFSGISFAIIGIVIPIVISYIQNRSIKAIEKNLETQMNTQKKEFEDQMDTQKKEFNTFNEQYKNLKEEISKQDKKFEKHEGSITHLEANFDNKIKEIDGKLSQADAWFWHSESLTNEKNNIAYSLETAYYAVRSYNCIKNEDGIKRVSVLLRNILEGTSQEVSTRKFNLTDLQNINEILKILSKISTDDKILKENIDFIKDFYDSKKSVEI